MDMYNVINLAIHSSGLRRIQKIFKMSTNFGQLQWLIGDLSSQQGNVRSDPQKGTTPTF